MDAGITSFRVRTIGALTAVVATMSLATTAAAAVVSISGGTRVDTIPQGNSGNSVLGQAGIGFAGGEIWVDGTLDNLTGVTLTLYDVGSESHWRNFIHLGNTSGKTLRDRDDHTRGSEGDFTNGPLPGQLVGSVTQNAGLADIWFTRLIGQEPELTTVINGQSPMMNVPGYGYASIAYAYLNESYQIVSGPTDRILVLLEDGGNDRDYDDYVGILVARSTSSAIPQYTVSPTSLTFGEVAINTTSAAETVTITNTGTIPLPIASVEIQGNNPSQFARTNNCPTNVSVGSSCTVSVVFAPTFTGDKAAALWVVAGGGGATTKVQLRGTGIDAPTATPQYTVSPTKLEFGSVAINTTSSAKIVTVTNTGTVALPIAAITLKGKNPGQFDQTNDCPTSVPVGSSCTISVVFKPTNNGSKAAGLWVDVTGGTSVKVALRGNASG